MSNIDEILTAAHEMAYSEAKVKLYLEAVKLADGVGDLQAGLNIREDLMSAAVSSGFPHEALVAFAWCLNQADQKRVEWYEDSLLWKYKWVIQNATHFPSITANKIFELQEDIFRRYEAAGASPRVRYYLQWDVQFKMGNMDAAHDAYLQWKVSEHDYYCDCYACEIDFEVAYLAYRGDAQKTLNAAREILNGRLRCGEVPHRTYAALLAPALALGNTVDAQRFHQKGYKLIKSNDVFIALLSHHLLYLDHVGDAAECIKMIEKHLSRVLQTKVPGYQIRFLFSAVKVLKKQSATSSTIKGPKDLPVAKVGARYDTLSMISYLENHALSLAQRFDARNGNTFVSDTMNSL